jgi:lipopolysaccharide transport system permease protein
MDAETIITSRGDHRNYWRRCWEYRELLWFIARRDFVVKYRQTAAGILWLLVRPASQVFIFTVVFGVMAGFKTPGNVPYPMEVMSGVVLWQFFSSVVYQSAGVLINNQGLITKVYFPRALLPISTVLPNLIDLTISFMAFLLLTAYYQWLHPYPIGHCMLPSWRLVFMPVPLGLAALVGVGLGFFFSAANVRYRDFVQVTGFIMQFLYLLSPVAWSSQMIKEKLPGWAQTIYYCNPLAVCIDLFRWCVMPQGFTLRQDSVQISISLGAGVVLVLLGQKFFRRLERTFADRI